MSYVSSVHFTLRGSVRLVSKLFTQLSSSLRHTIREDNFSSTTFQSKHTVFTRV